MREQARDGPTGTGECDHERSATRGDQTGEAGNTARGVEGEHCYHDRSETDRREPLGRPIADARWQIGAKHDQYPQHELPDARRRQKENSIRGGRSAEFSRSEAHRENDQDDAGQPGPARASARDQQERKREIELLLDRETPGVEQRLQFRCGREVAALGPEQDVRREQRDGNEAVGEGRELRGQHPEPGERQRDEHHEQERGEDSPRPALIEARDRERAAIQLVENVPTDQIAADDEEDVDADEAPCHLLDSGVKGDHRQHRDCAEPVDLGPIGRRRSAHGCPSRMLLALNGTREHR
ncbi:MAG: hypothetical protein MK142_17245 [Pseudomonadales bacterium]|nr:hypothetical protein [Pseudomonadales bacterium]